MQIDLVPCYLVLNEKWSITNKQAVDTAAPMTITISPYWFPKKWIIHPKMIDNVATNPIKYIKFFIIICFLLLL